MSDIHWHRNRCCTEKSLSDKHLHSGSCCSAEPSEVPEKKVTQILESSVKIGPDDLNASQLKIAKTAVALGFKFMAQRSLARVPETLRVNDTEDAKAGDVMKPEHDVETVTITGYFPGASRIPKEAPGRLVAFEASYENGKMIHGRIWHALGREIFREDPLGDDVKDGVKGDYLVKTWWTIKIQRDLLEWLDWWRKVATGESEKEYKERLAREKAEQTRLKKRASQAKIYMKYLDQQGVNYDPSDFD